MTDTQRKNAMSNSLSEDDALKYLSLTLGCTPEEVKEGALKNGCTLSDMAHRSYESILQVISEGKRMKLSLGIFFMWLATNGIQLLQNDITHAIEVYGIDGYSKKTLDSSLDTILYDLVRDDFSVKRADVTDYIKIVSSEHSYNPISLMLRSFDEWDGTDYIARLCELMHIADNELSCLLVRKWLWQSLSLAIKNTYEEPFGADGVLVLQGEQGIGKTTLAAALAIKPEFAKLGQHIDSKNKDTLITSTTTWICEMGEIETTFRSDLEALKAFITSPTDEYRAPYDRTNSKFPRRTSFIGTCNSTKFLADITGSRRFWTIHIPESMKYGDIIRFPFKQLWKQVETLVNRDAQGFRLTQEEQKHLAERNAGFEKPLAAEDEIKDLIATANEEQSRYEFRLQTVTDFWGQFDSIKKYSVKTISQALDKLGIPCERTKDGRFRNLPAWKRNDSLYRR